LTNSRHTGKHRRQSKRPRKQISVKMTGARAKPEARVRRASSLTGFLSPLSFRPPERIVPSAWHEHAPFAFWLVEQLRPNILVELGTHHGFSFFAFCQAIRMAGLSTAAFAVDLWTGDEHASFWGGEVFQGVDAYCRDRYSDIATLMKMSSVDALQYFEAGSIDLLHIDGGHYLEDRSADFRSWLPKLSNRSVVLFHDTNVREREFGANRFWSNLCKRHPNFSFVHGHGLGVLGVGKALPPAVANLLSSTGDETLRASIRNAYARLGGAVARNASEELIRQRDQLASALEGEKVVTAHANERRAVLGQEIESLRAAVRDGEVAAAKLRIDLEAMQLLANERECERDGLATALEGENAAVARAHEQAALLGQELETLRNAVQDREAEAEKLRADVQAVQAVSFDRNNEIAKLSRKLSEVQSAMREREQEIGRLSRDVEGTRRFLRDSQAEVQRLAGELGATREEIEQAESERRRASEAHAATARDLVLARGHLGQLQQERDKLYLMTRQLTSLRTQIAGLKDALGAALQEGDRKQQRIGELSSELQSAAAQALAVRGLQARLHVTSAEKDVLAAELARTSEEKRRVEQSAIDRIAAREAVHAAALAESENGAQAQIRALREQLVDAEAALAKERAERKRPPWKSEKRRLGRRLMQSGLFDADWYAREYPETAKNGRAPVEHYLEEGYLRGYRPNPLFDTRWYLSRYEDVRRAGINPLVHYLEKGNREGRNPGPEFETDFYLLTYPDVRASGMNPLDHYLRYGKGEGRSPKKR
jgi:Methyltransferase domain